MVIIRLSTRPPPPTPWWTADRPLNGRSIWNGPSYVSLPYMLAHPCLLYHPQNGQNGPSGNSKSARRMRRGHMYPYLGLQVPSAARVDRADRRVRSRWVHVYNPQTQPNTCAATHPQ